MKQVVSSNIKAIGYEPKTKILTVEFKQGGTYCYYEVPESAYNNFENAKSIGQFFSKHIRNAYRSEKMDASKQQEVEWRPLTEVEVLLLNISRGVPIDNLTEGERVLLEKEYGTDWEVKLGYKKD